MQHITQQEVMWYGIMTEPGLRHKYNIMVTVMAHGAIHFIIEIL